VCLVRRSVGEAVLTPKILADCLESTADFGLEFFICRKVDGVIKCSAVARAQGVEGGGQPAYIFRKILNQINLGIELDDKRKKRGGVRSFMNGGTKYGSNCRRRESPPF
jgi:hypothetical protein